MGSLLTMPLGIPNHFLMHCQSPCISKYCGANPCECDVKITDSDSDSDTPCVIPHA